MWKFVMKEIKNEGDVRGKVENEKLKDVWRHSWIVINKSINDRLVHSYPWLISGKSQALKLINLME